jgi:CBS domain-containing protein
MSARAALRLDTLGFSQVFRYKPGKQAWFAYGLPLEGQLASVPRAGDVARRDVPMCHLSERIGDVRERVTAASWVQCIVVGNDGVVLGRLRRGELNANPTATVEAVMEAGPTTIRPNTPLADIISRMNARKVGSIVVSNPDGQLIGILFREDGEQRLQVSSGNGE